jgi:hypothetical protein
MACTLHFQRKRKAEGPPMPATLIWRVDSIAEPFDEPGFPSSSSSCQGLQALAIRHADTQVQIQQKKKKGKVNEKRNEYLGTS